MHYIGIDLGTTNTVVTEFLDEGTERGSGSATRIKIDGQNDILPSVVAFDTGANRVHVGQQAVSMAIAFPDNVIASIKREIGNREWSRDFLGRKWSPADISAEILKYAKVNAEKALGEPINHVVITVPAYFNDIQRRRTQEAGQLAGLTVVDLLSEPMAAAFHYGWERKIDQQTILVYDLGGGTFDTCCLEIKGNEVSELGVKGHMYLGGDNFDDEILKMLIADLKSQSRINLDDLDGSDGVSRQDKAKGRRLLRGKAREIKEDLSEKEEVQVSLPVVLKKGGEPIGLETVVKRSRFEAAIESLVEETLKIVGQSLDAAKKKKKDVNKVILVGGSTKVPMVRRRVAEYFGQEPHIADVARAVSMGAALYAWNLTLPTAVLKRKAITTRTLGLEIVEMDPTRPFTILREGVFSPVLDEGLQLPASESKRYYPASHSTNKVVLKVFQAEGKKESTRDCTWAGDVEVGVSRYGAIDVTFTMNDRNILEVKACLEGGAPITAVLQTDQPSSSG